MPLKNPYTTAAMWFPFQYALVYLCAALCQICAHFERSYPNLLHYYYYYLWHESVPFTCFTIAALGLMQQSS